MALEETIGMNRGVSRNDLAESFLSKRNDRALLATAYTSDWGVVIRYDHLAQTVDVALLMNPSSPPLLNIPILGGGGNGLRVIQPLKGISSGDEPDIGMILFPRLESTKAWTNFLRKRGVSNRTHNGVGAMFIPGATIQTQTQLANAVATNPAPHEIGPGDAALIKASGAGFIVKEDGTVIIRGESIYFLGLNQTVANAQAVARQGDAGDGLGGAIGGGSSVVRSG